MLGVMDSWVMQTSSAGMGCMRENSPAQESSVMAPSSKFPGESGGLRKSCRQWSLKLTLDIKSEARSLRIEFGSTATIPSVRGIQVSTKPMDAQSYNSRGKDYICSVFSVIGSMLLRTRERAVYSWPCANGSMRRSRVVLANVTP